MYFVEYSPVAEKFFRKLKDKPLKEKYLNAIRQLEKDPYIGERKKGDLAGIWCVDFVHQGTTYELAYRIYEDPDQGIVVVILAGSRENFYKELKRYLR